MTRKLSQDDSAGSPQDESYWCLIIQARSGNPVAIEELVNHFETQRKAKVMAIMLMRDASRSHYRDAKDLQQEILILLWAKITTFKGEKLKIFWGWLWTLARNQYFDFCRSLNKERLVEKEGLGNVKSASEDDPFLKLALREWWNSLTEQQIQIMILSVEGYILVDIAQRLRISKSQTHRVLQEAQRKLEVRICGRDEQTGIATQAGKKGILQLVRPTEGAKWKRRVKPKN